MTPVRGKWTSTDMENYLIMKTVLVTHCHFMDLGEVKAEGKELDVKKYSILSTVEKNVFKVSLPLSSLGSHSRST